jgi:hypothetical protein
MKRASCCWVLFFCMAVTLPAQTQQTDNPAAPTNFVKRPFTLSGEIGQAGKIFVSDGDHRLFAVNNPETLRDLSGQHVTLRCRLDEAHNNLQVLRVKTFSPQRAYTNLGDAAFRR